MSEPEPETEPGQKRYCEICGTELDYIGRFTESKDNPDGYPEGSMREYDCPKCGSRRVEEEIPKNVWKYQQESENTKKVTL